MHVLKIFLPTIRALLVITALITFVSLASVDSVASAASAAGPTAAFATTTSSVSGNTSAATNSTGVGTTAQSATTAKSRPNRKAYMIQPGLFTEDPFVVVNGEALTPARWSPLLFNLEDSMKDNAAAASLARSHEAYGKASGIVLWSGMAASAAYAMITPRDQFSSGIFWGTFGGSIAVSYGLERVANLYLQRAIHIYNSPAYNSPATGPGAIQKTSELKMNLIPLEKGAAFSFALDY